jgi:hypothetical protein
VRVSTGGSPGIMNFFGHAAVAARHVNDREPELTTDELAQFCLGSMLPDFIGMLRLRRPLVSGPLVARGVRFHHHTDQAFHELPSFLRLSREAFAWLTHRELPRGPSRAIAHVGVEILLDELLAADEVARSAYLAALEVPLTDQLSFDSSQEEERLAKLRQALSQHRSARTTPTPDLVAARIRRSLAGRPRLATDDAGEALLSHWVTHARPEVAREAPELLATLTAQLANFEQPK